MTMWVVRNPGGQFADEMISRKIVSIGWADLSDLSDCKTPEDFYARYRAVVPDAKPQAVVNAGRQLYKFFREMKVGDYVVTYDSSKRMYYVGQLASEAVHDPQATQSFIANYRSVNWQTEVPRDGLSDPAKNSLGSTLTIFQPSVETQSELIGSPTSGSKNNEAVDVEQKLAVVEAEDPLENALENSKELIKDKLSRLSWQEMQRLVAGLLRAMGYKTRISPDGSDRGKDIIASPDVLMLEHPRIFVEVKHRHGAMGAPEVRKFIGGRDPSNDRCVYVSTGGFTKEAMYEAERSRIPLTLIDSDELFEILIAHYDAVDSETRTLLPLRKTYWPI